MRGRGGRGSYRGSGRGHHSNWNSNSGRGGYSNSSRFSSNSSFSSMDHHHHRNDKYGGFSGRSSNHLNENFGKPYRSFQDSSYGRRDSGPRSPDRKRMRSDGSGSRYESISSYNRSNDNNNSEMSSYSDRRGYSGERPSSSTPYTKRDEYRGRSSNRGGSYRGRLSSRGAPRGLRGRERPPLRRRLVDTSYAIRKRPVLRSSGFRRQRIARMRSSNSKHDLEEMKHEHKEKEEKPSSEELKKDKELNEENEEIKEEKMEENIKKENGGDDDNSSETLEDKLKKRKSFVKLICPHCNVKVLTFGRYERHLMSRTHVFTMKKIAMKQKSILAQMRSAQRNTQNELEKNNGDDLGDHTNFCPLCKLNYKQKKAVHQLSEAHKNMKKFLMPECKICNIAFKSPMSYENHCCSIKHIKLKQRVEEGSGDESAEEDNLENFTTIDSVGDADNENTDNEGACIGVEKIRRVEVFYCDLCKMYLPRCEESETSNLLSGHCKQTVHIKRYQQFKDKEELKVKVEDDKKNDEKKSSSDGNDDVEKKENVSKDNNDDDMKDEEAKDDKLWADVDKDLGDILAEAESGNKSSDEDEEDSHVNGERYDRFKLSIDGEAKETEEQ